MNIVIRLPIVINLDDDDDIAKIDEVPNELNFVSTSMNVDQGNHDNPPKKVTHHMLNLMILLVRRFLLHFWLFIHLSYMMTKIGMWKTYFRLACM
jgi:hypothetical protein